MKVQIEGYDCHDLIWKEKEKQWGKKHFDKRISPLIFKVQSEKTSKRHQLSMAFCCVFRFLSSETRKHKEKSLKVDVFSMSFQIEFWRWGGYMISFSCVLLLIIAIFWYFWNPFVIYVCAWYECRLKNCLYPAYILPHTLNCICVSLFQFHIWILE